MSFLESSYDPSPFWIIWGLIMSAGLLVWWLGLRARARVFGAESAKPTSGRTEVARPPAELCRELASRLAGNTGLFSARITSCTPTEVRAELRHLGIYRNAGTWREDGFASLVCLISPTALGGSLITWSVDGRQLVEPFRPWTTIVAGAGLVALAVVGVVIPLFVIPDPRPGVHFQVFQTLQVAHLLWPPFVLSAVARRQRRHLEDRAGDLLANLAYLD